MCAVVCEAVAYGKLIEVDGRQRQMCIGGGWRGGAEIAQQLEDMCSQTSGPNTCQRVMAACSKVHISEAIVYVHVSAGKPSSNTASILTDQHGYNVYNGGHGAVIHRDGNMFSWTLRAMRCIARRSSHSLMRYQAAQVGPLCFRWKSWMPLNRNLLAIHYVVFAGWRQAQGHQIC